MDIVKSNTNRELVICGRGRIGGALAESLRSLNIQVINDGRIDSELGLIFSESCQVKNIGLLVICISARQKSNNPQTWQWKNIFRGLIKQINSQQISVKNIVMVSSTRVYEGIKKGIVTAKTTPEVLTEAGQGLLEAEKQLNTCFGINLLILRCSGLYGALYPVYTPILKAGEGKVRCGVEAESVVQRLVDVVKHSQKNNLRSGVELLTDNKVYWGGKCFCFEQDTEQINLLAQTQRLLKNSQFYIE
ncbi:hypothetical protein [Aliikangiella sp. IMCC44359]|uniref:hypothetical protein n=1 Tax=Aliikangiella sp. IMCC44359 TaxID=3459125 RepID=UPI00403B1D70